MKHLNFFKILIIAVLIIISACKSEKNTEENKPDMGEQINIDKADLIQSDSVTVIADSIMYIADVKNADPNQAYYMDEWLSGAKIDVLANHIFKAVYDNRVKAYDYLTGEEMTSGQVDSLEQNWKREDIGQILFTEDWFFDQKQLKFYKQVNSVMLAYFRYDSVGNISGNKSGIRIYFNDTKPMKGALDY